MGTELAVTQNYELAKSVCTGVKLIVTSFKRDGIIRKNEIKVLQENLKARRAAQRIQNTDQLFILSMDKIENFMNRYDIDNMRPEEAKIFYSKLEKLNNQFDNIIEEYSKQMV